MEEIVNSLLIGTDFINEDPLVELDHFLGENMELTKGFTNQDALVKVVTHMIDWYKGVQKYKEAICGEPGRNGIEPTLEELKKDAIHCNVFWHDGPLLDYTQEQQDDALERIRANVGDKVMLIILKDE